MVFLLEKIDGEYFYQYQATSIDSKVFNTSLEAVYYIIDEAIRIDGIKRPVTIDSGIKTFLSESEKFIVVSGENKSELHEEDKELFYATFNKFRAALIQLEIERIKTYEDMIALDQEYLTYEEEKSV